MFERKSLQDVLADIDQDRDTTRFIARFFFVNNLETYLSLVKTLSNKADITIRLSDEKFCKGSDTIPSLKELDKIIDENTDNDILIPHLGEYLRIGKKIEEKYCYIHRYLLSKPCFSEKRVWIPIFLAQDLFQSILGLTQQDEIRFGQYLICIDDTPVDFSVTIFSEKFADQEELIDAVGVREWLSLWDNLEIKSGMSYATGQIKQITHTSEVYTQNVFADPFEYIQNALIDKDTKLSKDMGTDEQWKSLIPLVASNNRMDTLILRVLNVQKFNPEAIVGSWQTRTNIEKWLFILWYQLGLNKSGDYISFAVDQVVSYQNLLISVECAIIDCQNNPKFNEWLPQRNELLKKTGYHEPSSLFLKKFDQIADTNVKLKILTGLTHYERTKILEILSDALKNDKSIDDFKVLLQEKYPDLLMYLKPSNYLSGELNEYINDYKMQKIKDSFSLDFSNKVDQIDIFKHYRRGEILNSLKNSVASPHFIWFDGLGIEWIDMLLEKIKFIDSNVVISNVEICTAVLPTTTKRNMAKADPETTGDKINDLDNTSHIIDNSDRNYFSIVAKQFKLMDKFAHIIVDKIKSNPDEEIIVTADHGLSRMAVKGFHEIPGVPCPSNATAFYYGRYCELSSENISCNISNTKKEDKYVVFLNYNHFISQGNPLGEIHGGASPEELLVPVLHFAKYNQHPVNSKYHIPKNINYTLVSSEVCLDADSTVTLTIQTDEPVKSLYAKFKGIRITGISSDNKTWSIKIIHPDLYVENSYTIRIYPNNFANQREDTFTIKRKGLDIDDDF